MKNQKIGSEEKMNKKYSEEKLNHLAEKLHDENKEVEMMTCKNVIIANISLNHRDWINADAVNDEAIVLSWLEIADRWHAIECQRQQEYNKFFADNDITEDEEYGILWDAREKYISPFFDEEEEKLSDYMEVRFYPDRDARLYICKNGECFFTD